MAIFRNGFFQPRLGDVTRSAVGPQYEIGDTGPRGGTVVSISPGSVLTQSASSFVAPGPLSPMLTVSQPSSMLMPGIPDRALVTDSGPGVMTEPSMTSSASTSSASMPSGASAADLQRQPGSRVAVTPEVVEALVREWPNYFYFAKQAQGSVSTSAAVEATLADRVAAQEAGRRIVPIEQRQGEASVQKVAAYCVQQAPEGGASTGNMVPVDANCGCPQGYSRVGECPKTQDSAGGSKWWILLLVGAGVWAYSRRK